MKYIKNFENITQEPKVGDYVQLYIDESDFKWERKDKDLSNFLNTKIGKISRINSKAVIIVQYVDVPDNITKFFNYNGNDKYCYGFLTTNIKEIGNSKEEVKMKIQANKYNL